MLITCEVNLYHDNATIQSRIVPTTKPHGYFGHMTLHL